MVEFYRFRLDAQRLVPILQRDLYKDPNTMLRELAQNATDSLTRRAKLQPSFNPKTEGRITFDYDKNNKCIVVSDNGCGMTRELLLEVFRFYGRSDKDEEELGCRGLGAKSIFACADSFNIHTHSIETGETLNVYVTLEGLSFLDSVPRREAGTTITIPSKETFNKYSLEKFCRCIEYPIFTKEGASSVLLSKQAPYPSPVAVLHGDGYDVYLPGEDERSNYRYSRSELYVGGIHVNDFHSDGPDRCAINVKRKELVDLTISRDSYIENEKWQRFIQNVEKLVADTFAEISITPELISTEQGFALCAWAHSQYKSKVMQKDEAKKLAEIMDRVRFVGNLEGFRGPTFNASLLSAARPEGKIVPVYYTRKSLSNILNTIKRRPLEGDARVIYWSKLSNAVFQKWIDALNISQFEIEDVLPRSRLLFTPHKQESIQIEELGSAWTGPVVVFPLGVDSKMLRAFVRYFQCAAIKLTSKEALPRDCEHRIVDLREEGKIPKVWYKGTQTTKASSLLVKEGVEIAPLFLEKYVDVTCYMPVAVPCDLESAARLLMEGVKMVKEEGIVKILASKVPAENSEETIDAIDFDNLSAVAEIIPQIDWTHPYAAAIFHYCVMELTDERYSWTVKSNYSPCKQVFNGRGYWGYNVLRG